MNIGIPRMRRPFVYRGGLVRTGKEPLNSSGCSIFIVRDADTKIGFPDLECKNANKQIVVVKLRAEDTIKKKPTIQLGVTPFKEELRHLSRFARQGG